MTVKECEKEIENLKKEISDLKAQISTGENPAKVELEENEKRLMDAIRDTVFAAGKWKSEKCFTANFYYIENSEEFQRRTMSKVLIQANDVFTDYCISYTAINIRLPRCVAFTITCFYKGGTILDHSDKDPECKPDIFDDLKVGDEVKIPMGDGEEITAYVAGINCEPDVNVPHYTLVANFGNSPMGKTALHGYIGAEKMLSFLDEEAEKLKEYFGERLVEREIMVSSGIDEAPDELFARRDFCVTDYTPLKTYLYLMSEVELFGERDFSLEYEIHKDRYPLFKEKDYIELFGSVDIWLRSVGLATAFCLAGNHGSPNYGGASGSLAAVALFTIR